MNCSPFLVRIALAGPSLRPYAGHAQHWILAKSAKTGAKNAKIG
jgi:hypothetical protein